MSTTSLAVNLARKAKQILDTKFDDETLLQSLSALSGFSPDDTPLPPPQQLTAAIESGSLQSAEELLHLAEGVSLHLADLHRGVSELRQCTTQMCEQLDACAVYTRPYLESIDALQSAVQTNEQKLKLIDDVLHRYQLLPEETALLESGEVNEIFFETLNKAQSIQANCKHLLRTHQRAGLELMDTMARVQEAAMKRLVHWVQTKCQELVDVEAAETDVFMQRSLEALSARPVLYRYCAEAVAETRHDGLFEKFVRSLLSGHRPIEMQSDDPKRYLNDMLAWVHQSLASEMELLAVLFKDVSGVHDTSLKELPSMTDLLNAIFRSIDRPLKVRIEQVLMLPPGPVVCFELTRLLEFYVGVVRDVGGESFILAESIQGCLDMAVRTLQEHLHSRGVRLERQSIIIPRDGSPPSEVSDAVRFLMQLLDVDASAMKTTETGLSVASLVMAVVEPLLTTCQHCAEEMESGSLQQDDPSKRGLSKHVFMINCLEALVSSLTARPAVYETHSQLQSQLQFHVKALAKGAAGSLLGECGLSSLLERMKEYKEEDSSAVMSDDASLSLEHISKSMKAFFVLISNRVMPEFSEIIDVNLRNAVISKMTSELTSSYQYIYQAVQQPEHGYGSLAAVTSIIEHSPDDIKTILSVECTPLYISPYSNQYNILPV